MSSDKVEKDYKDFETRIERMAGEELRKIKKKTDKIKEQAERAGGEVEAFLNEPSKKKG